jgi:predicted HicB family RNase H-like nuclease
MDIRLKLILMMKGLCMLQSILLGQGKTLNEAFDCLSEQLQMALNDLDPEKYSGNFNLRIPPTLHARLAKVAKLQDKSINELVIGGINQIVNL